MSYLLQHGYGKSTKIADLDSIGLLGAGAILSCGNEGQTALEDTVSQVTSLGKRALLDPQSYIYAVDGANARHHADHNLEFDDMSWSPAPRTMARHVEAVVRLNERMSVDRVIGPSPYLYSFKDVWAPLTIQYARELSDQADKTYATLAVEDVAFSDWDDVADWLDAFTTVDVTGVYLLIGKSRAPYPQLWNSAHLTNVLRAIHWLSVLNGYRVIWGYSDVVGLLGVAAGAKGGATGWSHTLRSFDVNKWIPRKRGGTPHPRFFSSRLLTSLDGLGDAQTIAGSVESDILGASQDDLEKVKESSWGLVPSRQQHMESISRIHSELKAVKSRNRVKWMLERLDVAIAEAERLTTMGLIAEPAVRSRLVAMRKGFSDFADVERLS